MSRLLTVALLLLIAAAAAHAEGTATARPEAERVAERLLEAIGGRQRWAALRGTVNDSEQHVDEAPYVWRAVIHMDFTTPRFRIDSRSGELHVVRVVDGERDWRINREGAVLAMEPALRAADLRWYQAHVYRTLHRIAARDPALSLGLAADGRLEVFEHGARIAWYRLDGLGQPMAFGAHEDERGTLSGPWSFVQDGIHHPLWVSSPDASWRARLLALQTNPDLPDSLFARPEVALQGND